jgi:magnesium transporter
MSETGIRTRVWRNGALEAKDFPFEQVSDYLAEPDCLVWADLLQPDARTLGRLAEELDLDPLAVEDAVTTNERPKATRYASHLFLTASPVAQDPGSTELCVGRVSAFSTKQALVTVRLDDLVDVDAVVRRWDENSDLLRHGSKALVYGLLDWIVDGYFDVLDGIEDAVEEVEDLLFGEQARVGHQVSRRAFELRRALVDARRVISPMREVINTVTRRGVADQPPTELAPYYDDLYDHMLRVTEWTDSLRDSITSIFDTNMSLADSRMNAIMKKLTGWAAIVAVPTAVTGYFGQNVPYPGYNERWGFWVSTAVMVAIAGVLYVVFRVKDWL